MIRGRCAAFAALFIGLFIICQCAGTTSALRIPGCPHKSKDAVDHPGIALELEEATIQQRVGRALLQEAGGGSEPTGIAAWNPRTHGYTVGISFGIVMPFAALISRGFREYPGWFWLHAPLGVAAFIGGLLGVIWGAKLPSDDLDNTLYDAHKAIGSIVLALAGVNLIAAILRPKTVNNKRYLWNHFHHWTGRIAIVLAIVNMYLGLHLSDELAKFFWGYAIIVGALILVWLAKEAIDFVRVKADNKRVDRAGFEASKLPGGIPMNGNFAPVLMQRRPAESGLPIAGHGIPGYNNTRPKVADEQTAMAAANANKGPAPVSNGFSGVEPNVEPNNNGYGNTTGYLHQSGVAPRGVEMARY